LCRSQALVGSFSDEVWTAPRRTPPLYPDAVTLSPKATAEQIMTAIDLESPGASVKDSFALLDLSPWGFRPLFEAFWVAQVAQVAQVALGSPAEGGPGATQLGAGGPARAPSGLFDDTTKVEDHPPSWSRVTNAQRLGEWLDAQRRVNGEAAKAPFTPQLLNYPNVRILARYPDGSPVIDGGVVLHQSAVLTVTNFFAATGEHVAVPELLTLLGQTNPGLPIVDYVTAEDLPQARALGFSALGPLRVWVRP
jgi:hypothetical protein